MQGSPITQKEVEALMESIDVDATGSIDYDEFLAATINMSQLQVCFLADRPGLNPSHSNPDSHMFSAAGVCVSVCCQ